MTRMTSDEFAAIGNATQELNRELVMWAAPWWHTPKRAARMVELYAFCKDGARRIQESQFGSDPEVLATIQEFVSANAWIERLNPHRVPEPRS